MPHNPEHYPTPPIILPGTDSHGDAPQTAKAGPGGYPPGFRTTLMALWLGALLTPFFMSGVVTLLPVFAKAWNGTAVEQSMVMLTYALAQVLFNILGGRFGDLWGRKRMLLIGVCTMSVSSVGIGFCDSMTPIIVLRFIQGFGGAIISSTSMAIAMSLAPKELRGRVMGVLSSGTYLGLTLGPIVAGFMATWLNWRWLFYGVLIPGLLVAIVVSRNVRQEWREAKGEKLDWMGVALLSFGLACLVLGVVTLPSWEFSWTLVVAGFALLFFFYRHQIRARYPIVDVHIFHTTPGFSVGLLTMFANFGASSGMGFFVGLYLQQVRMLSPFEASIFLVLQSAVQVCAATFGGRLSDRFGSDIISPVGMGICALSLFGMTQMGLETPLVWLYLILGFMGLGIAIFSPANTVSTLACVAPKNVSIASGLVGSMRTMGLLTSQTLAGMVIASIMGDVVISAKTSGDFMSSMAICLHIFAFLNLVGIALALNRLWRGRSTC